MASQPNTWTPDDIRALRDGHQRGLTAGQLTAKLGGRFSRAAVLGKMGRLGLRNRARPGVDAIYHHLCHLAEAGGCCPTNAELAVVAGYDRPKSVTDALSDLRSDGRIIVELHGHIRLVTICETGKRTAEPLAWRLPPFRPKRPVREIAQTAVALSGRPAQDVLGRSRFREHVRVRQVIFGFAVREGWQVTHTARVLGFDHSTGCHALKMLPEFAAREPETAALIEAMHRELPPLPEVCAA